MFAFGVLVHAGPMRFIAKVESFRAAIFCADGEGAVLPGDHMSVESTLRAQARRLMQAGKLPNRPPDRMWGGPGVGTSCTLCGEQVKQNETELEVEWSEDACASNHRFHVWCLAALELEIREGGLIQGTQSAGGQMESAATAFTADKPPAA